MKNLSFNLIRSTVLAITFIVITPLLHGQTKIYANSQSNHINGVCLLCAVQDPQNAVGSNENDFSILRIPVGIAASAEQTLFFPNHPAAKIEKLTIGIGTNNNTPLSVQQLKGITLQTIALANINSTRVIDSQILNIDTQDPTKGTIKIETAGPISAVKIMLNSQLINLDGNLRIYYAYKQQPHNIPFCSQRYNPIAKYSFNGNMEDEISGFNMTHSIPPTFQNEFQCGQGLIAPEAIEIPSIFSSDHAEATIAFWAKAEKLIHYPKPDYPAGFTISAFGVPILLEPKRIIVGFVGAGFPISYHIPITPNKLHHYVITLKKIINFGALRFQIHIFIDGQEFTVPVLLYTPGMSEKIFINMELGQLDEFLVYPYALNSIEASNLYTLYNHPITKTAGETPLAENLFTVSPNPTKGQITLDGNILFTDANISISNISGKEVYHSKFESKTFELPAALPEGIYIISLKTKEGKTYVKKIILRR